MIKVSEHLSIPDEELIFSASRSSGPGGQNVNKVATRIMLQFNVPQSPSLLPWHKQRIIACLAKRINRHGDLQIASQQHRTQSANRESIIQRFIKLLQIALTPTRPRKKTRITLAAKKRRLEQKRRHSTRKQDRSKKISPTE